MKETDQMRALRGHRETAECDDKRDIATYMMWTILRFETQALNNAVGGVTLTPVSSVRAMGHTACQLDASPQIFRVSIVVRIEFTWMTYAPPTFSNRAAAR